MKTIWEHEFNEQLETNLEMNKFCESLSMNIIEGRTYFYGGRTTAVRLLVEKKTATQQIRYIDVVIKFCN